MGTEAVSGEGMRMGPRTRMRTLVGLLTVIAVCAYFALVGMTVYALTVDG